MGIVGKKIILRGVFSMQKSKLMRSADKITKVSESNLKEFTDKTQLLNAKMNETMLGRKDILELISGKENISTMKDIHENNLNFIGSILQIPNSETLVDTTLWTFRAYMSRGFTANYFAAQINTWIELIKQNISTKAFIEIKSIYNWIGVNIPIFTIAAQEELEKSKLTYK